ncbi:MAG TPA: rhomboid family intramembrane serine protease [Gemmatimonadales bacterium]|nr:rhomboid family intramembrane serine protease [Gemmatimonadales bacterium]
MTPGVRGLLIANVVVYLLTTAYPGIVPALMLVPVLIPVRPWTVVTYMFLHAGLWHLVFNMLALYFFGPRVEGRIGTQQFFGLYGVSGLLGAITSLATPSAAIVGASAAIFGVMFAYARYWPRDLILVWGIVPIQARWFVIGMTALSLYAGFGGAQAGVAHFAHLGGFLGGWLYVRWLEHRSGRVRGGAGWPVLSRAQPPGAALARWQAIPLDRLHPVNREEVSRLLQKAAEGGTLTPEEQAVLDRFVP